MHDLVPQPICDLGPCRGQALAVFDADGTLWDGDVAEDFAQWMVTRGTFSADAWHSYEKLNVIDTASACLHMLWLYKGHAAAAIAADVRSFWSQHTPRWIPEARAALAWATTHGYRTWIVTASPEPLMACLAETLGVERVLALELEVSDGRYTGGPDGIPTIGACKLTRIRAAGTAPIRLAAGNSTLDGPMLAASQGIAWAVHPSRELAARAARQGWLVLPASA